MDTLSFINAANPKIVEELFAVYQKNADELDVEWRRFFDGFTFQTATYGKKESGTNEQTEGSVTVERLKKEVGITKLIEEYRRRGHLFTKSNPVRERREYFPKITIDRFDLAESDRHEIFDSGRLVGMEAATLQQIIDKMEKTYCQHIGCEYKFIRRPDMIKWLEHRMEDSENTPSFSTGDKNKLFKKLSEAVLFEQFMHTRFVGQKRFSSEGVETFVPAVETVVEYGASVGVEEYVIGMAHRGRLNLLGSVMHKPYEDIFNEFEGKGYEDGHFGGDVKYHMGFSQDRMTESNRKVHLSLLPNPSHLEAVNPVVEGVTRAKIEQRYDHDYKKIIPILLHGDASVAGQGIIYEVIQFSHLPGYKTGGTIHIVLNNQIGFTAGYLETRSTTYCTDIAKISKCPIFHVNGDDVEAVVFAIKIAIDFRQEFHQDVFIDILGYRRHGHNEGDDPRFSQPLLYDIISKHDNSLKIYSDKLIKENVLTKADIDNTSEQFFRYLDEKLAQARQTKNTKLNSYHQGDWKGFKVAETADLFAPTPTGVDKNKLSFLADRIMKLPKDYTYFSKISKVYHDRHTNFFEKGITDWAMGEQLAYASLLDEGYAVRLSGQDCKRGTFSHRHGELHVKNKGKDDDDYIPLNNISANQAKFSAYNSILSEYGVMGFDYGYSIASPNYLSIWEAQFGDFANGAQIIIDQFLSGAESKWQRMNGLVLYLPHGYEGQGPEHSNGRPERFLQLCAENNMQVMNITQPANLFHALRRQLRHNFRKPLIIFTPKSLLRHPDCISKTEDYLTGNVFKEIIDENNPPPDRVNRLLLCTGKIYFDLMKEIKKQTRETIAVVRIEQLYPLRVDALRAVYDKYGAATKKIWVQEEPENMGAGHYFILKNLKMGHSISIISRKESAAVSTGFIQIHKKEQESIINMALNSTV